MSWDAFWREMDEKARAETERALRELGWRLVEGGRGAWKASRRGTGAFPSVMRFSWMVDVDSDNHAMATGPDELLKQVREKNAASDRDAESYQ